MPGAILWRWSEGRQRIFHGVLFSLRRMVPQEMWKYSCRHLSWRKKSCCMEMLKILIKAETYQIERFFEVTIHWWVIGTLRTKNVSFKSHTYMKSFFGQFWNEKKNLFFSSESSQENAHGGVHFWNSYRYCCSQLFKKELHYSQV